ncbi:hypothetical protein EYV94_20725 [Puteibacter caeruleilacunae]|nr:hypothetical protein EYV94_20725 [Puteibacter caeruleilacunae]
MKLNTDKMKTVEEMIAELLEKESELARNQLVIITTQKELERRFNQFEKQVNNLEKEQFTDYITSDYIAANWDMTPKAVERKCEEYGIPGIKFSKKMIYLVSVFLKKLNEHRK